MNIIKPTLVLDKNKCLKNITFMCEKAKRLNLRFRPHFKTHQSLEIGRWFKDVGVNCITVSSVEMAQYFMKEWNDITIAFPMNILEMELINEIADKISLNILIVEKDSLSFLIDHLKSSIGVYLKIDTGTHRTGIDPNDLDQIAELIEMVKKNKLINFKGFLAHTGHTYRAKSKSEVETFHKNGNKILFDLQKTFSTSKPEISIGDTPATSLADDFSGITEIRPGNFVFYDVTQTKIGSCNYNQIAVTLAVPVVAKHKERNEIVVYGGAIHLSKDVLVNENGSSNFGLIVKFDNNSWSSPINGMYVKSVSQEHGIIKCNKDEFDKIKIGDILGVLPIHSCLTVSCMRSFLTFDNKIIKTM